MRTALSSREGEGLVIGIDIRTNMCLDRHILRHTVRNFSVCTNKNENSEHVR